LFFSADSMIRGSKKERVLYTTPLPNAMHRGRYSCFIPFRLCLKGYFETR